MRKASVKWKNWRDFRVLHWQLQDEDWSKIEIRDTILELAGKIQELQNEINCMNMIREILRMLNQYAVDNPTLPVNQCFSHLIQILVELPSRSLGMPSRNDGQPRIWDTHGISENVYANPTASSSAPFPQESNPMDQNTHHHMWWVEADHQFRIRDASPDRQPKIQSSPVSEDFQRIMGQTNIDCRVQILILTNSPRQQRSLVRRYKIQDWGMYLLTISYGSYAVDQRSGVDWFSGWSKIFVFFKRDSSSRLWGTRRENCFSTEQNHPEYPVQKENQSGGTKSSKRGPFPSWMTDRLLDLRVLPGHWEPWFCRILYRPVHYFSSKWWYSGIRFEMGRNFMINDENPIWWHLGRIVQIRNTRFGSQDLIITDWRQLWTEVSSRIYESGILRPETEIMKETPWSRIRRQNSVNKELWDNVGIGKPTGSVLKENNCSFRHDVNKRAKLTQPNPSPREAKEGKWLDCRARVTSKELAPIHSMKNGILQNACSTSPKMDANWG